MEAELVVINLCWEEEEKYHIKPLLSLTFAQNEKKKK